MIPNKAMLGIVRGGAVRLDPEHHRLILCEGIENGLAVRAATGLPTWCCLSVGGLGSVVLSVSVREIVIAADGDVPGSPASLALERAAARLTRQGCSVTIARPPVGKDFNDLIAAKPPHPETEQACRKKM